MLTEDETKALDRGLMASPMLSHQALTIARKYADLLLRAGGRQPDGLHRTPGPDAAAQLEVPEEESMTDDEFKAAFNQELDTEVVSSYQGGLIRYRIGQMRYDEWQHQLNAFLICVQRMLNHNQTR